MRGCLRRFLNDEISDEMAEQRNVKAQSSMVEEIEDNTLTQSPSDSTWDGETSVSHLKKSTSSEKQDVIIASHHYEPQHSTRPWMTTFLRFGPISGIMGLCSSIKNLSAYADYVLSALGMLMAMACVFASLGILAGSNRQPTENWSIPPSTVNYTTHLPYVFFLLTVAHSI